MNVVVMLTTIQSNNVFVTAFLRQEQKHQCSTGTNNNPSIANKIRGGDNAAAIDVEEIESSDYDYESEEEEEEEMGPSISATLTKATQKAATKVVKTSVAAAMKKTKKKKPKKKSSSLLTKYLRIPYIVKACLNPLVFFQMTKAYWASLISHNYLDDKKGSDSSQDLRSALEQKARQAGSGGKRRGKKRMKPGQAKTISDLPALNT